MKPLVERLKKEYEGKVEFRLYNVEEDQTGVALADELDVQYVPTFVFATKDGVVSSKVVGEQTEQQLRTGLDALN